MRNLLFKITFEGSSFHGWQIQNDLKTVQGELKNAFLSVTNEDVVINGKARLSPAKGNPFIFEKK